MTNWLMASSIYGGDINSTFAGRPWPYRVYPNDKLRSGDLVYLLFGDMGVYAWGYITGIESYNDPDLDREMTKLLVSRPVVQAGLVSAREMKQTKELARITEALDGNFVALTLKQCNALNGLIRLHGAEAPADVSEFEDEIGPFGVRNTTSLHAKLRRAVEQYKTVTVLFLDLDNFKAVNDDFDHATGDQVIREALDTVQGAIGSGGELFHRSGDEMIVLLPNQNTSDSYQVAERIRLAIEHEKFSTVGSGVVTATIGLVSYPDEPAWDQLVNQADQIAMHGKKRARNHVHTLTSNQATMDE
jgi:diguanylate cyclase (GGDEF)-like protein